MPITRKALLEAMNDAVEKVVDDYNEANDCEVMLTASANVSPTKSEMVVDGGNTHGVFTITIEQD